MVLNLPNLTKRSPVDPTTKALTTNQTQRNAAMKVKGLHIQQRESDYEAELAYLEWSKSHFINPTTHITPLINTH